MVTYGCDRYKKKARFKKMQYRWNIVRYTYRNVVHGHITRLAVSYHDYTMATIKVH